MTKNFKKIEKVKGCIKTWIWQYMSKIKIASFFKKTDILKICKILENLREKLPDFAVKMFKTNFCLCSYVK